LEKNHFNKKNETAARCLLGDKDNISNETSENVKPQSHISREEEDGDDGKCILCNGKFSEDTSGEEWI
jgi:hypothetical protein